MADPSTQAVIKDPLPQGPSCLLLNGHVPQEVRDLIYQFTFEGAEVIFCPILPPRGRDQHASGSIRKGRSNNFQTTDHWKMLLTCRQVYDEGRRIFCAEMQLAVKYDMMDPLAHAVSDFTRLHVKKLALIWQPALTQDPSQGCVQKITNGLRQFPSLRVGILQPSYSPRFQPFRMLAQHLSRQLFPSSSTALVVMIDQLKPAPSTVPIVKVNTEMLIHREGRPRFKRRFDNYATGQTFVTLDLDIDNQEGFMRVIKEDVVTDADTDADADADTNADTTVATQG